MSSPEITRDSDVFGENEVQAERGCVEAQLSISEMAQNASSGRLMPPAWLTWIEYPFRVKSDSNDLELKEATGWSMDGVARGVVNQAGSFVGAALLRLATEDAGCKSARDCDTPIYGLKPSSLLTFTAAIVGVLSSIMMPFIGALVDHTRHRKSLGVVSAIVIVVITGVQISISRENYFAILILEAVGGFALLVHTTVVFAYLPDLTFLEEDLAHYTSRFNIRQYVVQTLYVALVVIISEIRGADSSVDSTVRTARQSLAIAFGISVICMPYAWLFLFRKRPALSKVPEGTNIFTAGFIKVGRTTRKIWCKHKSLKWFMISLLWSPEAGAGAVLSIAVTFMAIFLQLTAQEIGFVTLIFLGCCVPGSLVSKWVYVRLNPLNSYRAGLLFFAVVAFATFATLNGPDRSKFIYAFVPAWGLAVGWIYPCQRVLFCTLIPKGQETEMMGLFTFCGQILGWLPPLIFTVLNQRGISMQWAASILSFFMALSLCCTLPMGSYQHALSQVATAEKVESGTVSKESEQYERDGSSIPMEETASESKV